MSEEVKVKCGHCKHRLPKEICGCPESPHHNQQIGMSDSCDFFEHNPAQPLYSKALAKGVLAAGDETLKAEMLEDLETAIELGLCEDDEAYARFTLGAILSRRGYKCSPGEIDQPDFSRGIQEMEKAVLIDSQGGYGTFSNPINKAELVTLGAAYVAVENSILERKGIDPAIAYLEEKLHLFDYLPPPPLVMLYTLGELYLKKGDASLARQTFGRVLQAPDNLVEHEEEAKLRENAGRVLQALNSPDTKRSGCFIATAVYGGSDTAEIVVLRQFRDNFLLQNQLGRLFVHSYYLLSPPCAKLIEKSRLTKKLAERLLLRPIISIIQHTCRNTRR